jgi:hypothetical protein
VIPTFPTFISFPTLTLFPTLSLRPHTTIFTIPFCTTSASLAPTSLGHLCVHRIFLLLRSPIDLLRRRRFRRCRCSGSSCSGRSDARRRCTVGLDSVLGDGDGTGGWRGCVRGWSYLGSGGGCIMYSFGATL